MSQKSSILVLSGLSGAGKSTLGEKLRAYLADRGRRVVVMDGDRARSFFDGALGYSPEDRLMVSKMLVFGACLLAEQGVDVILATMLSQPGAREFLADRTDFTEIHLDAEIEHCMENDVKDVYRENLGEGQPNLVGVDLTFSQPSDPDWVVKTHVVSLDESFREILAFLAQRGLFGMSEESA